MKPLSNTEYNFDLLEVKNSFSDKLPDTIVIHEMNINHTSIGRGLDYDTRLITAYAEIIERYNLWNQQPDLISQFIDDETQLSPIKQVLPMNTELDSRVVEWKSYQVLGKEQRLYLHRPINSKKISRYFQQTSSGSAIHQNKELARSSAIEELIERHLFNLFWYFERNISEINFASEEIQFSLFLGWDVLFYELKDYKSATLCIMLNKSDSRFPTHGLILGLSYGEGSKACLRAYSECLQALEGYLVFNRKLNDDLIYYLSGKGTKVLLDKISRALNSPSLSITKAILDTNEVYSFEQKTMLDLIYCEVVIPELLPFQVNVVEGIRIPSRLMSNIKKTPRFNPIG